MITRIVVEMHVKKQQSGVIGSSKSGKKTLVQADGGNGSSMDPNLLHDDSAQEIDYIQMGSIHRQLCMCMRVWGTTRFSTICYIVHDFCGEAVEVDRGRDESTRSAGREDTGPDVR